MSAPCPLFPLYNNGVNALMRVYADYSVINSSGGPKAWKEMRQRQMEFYQSWDEKEAMKKKPVEEEDASELQEEFEGDDGGAIEEDPLQAKRHADEDEEEQSEPVSITTFLFAPRSTAIDVQQAFSMAQMLQSLNINLSLLGYDEVEEKWID